MQAFIPRRHHGDHHQQKPLQYQHQHRQQHQQQHLQQHQQQLQQLEQQQPSQEKRATSDGHNAPSWRVAYLLQSARRGWRKHKSPHTVSIETAENHQVLSVKDADTSRVQVTYSVGLLPPVVAYFKSVDVSSTYPWISMPRPAVLLTLILFYSCSG